MIYHVLQLVFVSAKDNAKQTKRELNIKIDAHVKDNNMTFA